MKLYVVIRPGSHIYRPIDMSTTPRIQDWKKHKVKTYDKIKKLLFM
jgi:hypothetical protein